MLRPLSLDHVHDVFVRERLEIQPVAGVVVRGHCFRVAIDHDRFVSRRPKGIGRVHTAVVELDALANAVRARAKNGDLRAIRGTNLVVVLVGRVVIRRFGIELGGACVHRFERGNHAECGASGPYGGFVGLP